MDSPLPILQEEPWFKKGLKFHCTGCGKCCTGAPGFVWLSEEDIERLCKHFQLEREDFLKRYTRKVGKKISLLEDKKNYNCIFLRGKECSVYEGRPSQCRTFPWWTDNLKSEKDWRETAAICEGIDHEAAKEIPFEEIQKQLRVDRENDEKCKCVST